MTRWIPWLLLFLIPCLRFPGALPGPAVVSADDHLSVHHVFQEEAGGRVRHPQLSDPALQFSALRLRVVESLKRASPPLWNPDIWAGAPLLGDGQSSVGSPTTWTRLILPEDLAQDLSVAWVMLWMGVGTALLTGRLGAGPWGACAAGIAAMTGPYTQVWLLHPHAATFAWVPWVILCIERRAPLALAICTAGLLMGGHPETAAHCGAWAALWAIARGQWRTAALGLPIGALLAAPIILPLLEEILRSASLASHGGNRIAASQLLDLLWPGWHGHPALETWSGQGIWSDGRLHPGLGIMGLALLATVRRRRLSRGLMMAWAACIIVACLGLPGPANHARLGSMGAWFVTVAGGLGLSSLSARWRPAMTGVVIGTSLWACWPDQGSIAPTQHAPPAAPWAEALSDHLGCQRPEPQGCGRVVGLGWAIQPNTGAHAGIRDIRGYDLPVSWTTERMQRLFRAQPQRPWFQIDTAPSPDLLRFFAVRALASPSALPGRPVLDLGESPLAVHAVSGPAPRAWLATGARPSPDGDQAARQLAENPDPGAPPIVQLPGDWPAQGRTLPASVVQDSPERVVIEADTSVPAILILADAWHPGWTAHQQDGEVLPVLQVGGVIRGVALPAGNHRITFDYSPAGWRWGTRLAGVGLFLMLLIALRRRRRAHTSDMARHSA